MSTHQNRAEKRVRKTHQTYGRPPFETIALVLQGGGALGAYQAGAYAALAEAELHPDWVAGISIGAVNAALIAGNTPRERVDKLRRFWELVTLSSLWSIASSAVESVRDLVHQAGVAAASLSATNLALLSGNAASGDGQRALWEHAATNTASPFGADLCAPRGDAARAVAKQLSAALAQVRGAAGFFRPRLPGPWLAQPGTPEATSYYDTAPLKETLERLVDFDRLNAGETRFSVGAVNVATGNFVYFDNTTHRIGPEHIMASGALPPGFPAVEIEGEHYWDGGLVSNTPLRWVLESGVPRDTLAFQVDLWSARGIMPRTMAEVAMRQKEIQYSSRTRANSDHFKHVQKFRNALSTVLQRLPEDLRDSPDVALLSPVANRKVYNIIQLIYRSKQYEGDSKDYEFSRTSMEEHWRAGYHDTIRTLRHPEVLERPIGAEGVFTFDLANDGRE